MNLKRSPFSILDKDKREMDYIKGIYKRKIQSEIESYKDPEDEDKRDTIQAQDVLMLDRISIQLISFFYSSFLTSLAFNYSAFTSSYFNITTFTFGTSGLTSTIFDAIDSNFPLIKFTMKINIGTWASPPIMILVSE